MNPATALIILRHTTKPKAPTQCAVAKLADVPVDAYEAAEAGELDPPPAMIELLLNTMASTPRDRAVVHLTLKALGVEWQ